MGYVEQREFALRFEVRCDFPEDYDGDQDGYEWAKEFPPIAAEIVRCAIATVRAREGWTVRPGNRGRSSEDEVTLIVERGVK